MKRFSLVLLFAVAFSILSSSADAAARRRRCKRGGCRVTVDAPLGVVQDSFLR